MSRILHLTLTKKWFSMIASGEKIEEYRSVKPYWINRLTWHEYHTYGTIDLIAALRKVDTFRIDFEIVRFKNGYSKNAPVMDIEFEGIHYGPPLKQEWVDENHDWWYLCIKLGKILSIKNYKQ